MAAVFPKYLYVTTVNQGPRSAARATTTARPIVTRTMSSRGEAGCPGWERAAPSGFSRVSVIPTAFRIESRATPPKEDDGQDEGRDPAANRDNPEGDGRGLRWIYEGGDRGDEARRFQGVTEGHIDCLVRIIIRHSIGFVGQGDLMDDAV